MAVDILPMAQAGGFPVLTNWVPVSTRRAFPGSIQVWSYSLSAGVFLPASPAVGSPSGRPQETWFLFPGKRKREVQWATR